MFEAHDALNHKDFGFRVAAVRAVLLEGETTPPAVGERIWPFVW
jgi:hypothetical protein